MPKRTLEITILKDSKIREAIGAISVHWSVLELMVERAIATLEGNPGVVAYTSDLAHRLEHLKKLARVNLPYDEAEKLVTIAGTIKLIGKERHRAIHGLWGLNANGELINLFPRDRRGNIETTWTQEQLRNLKLRIWREGIKALAPWAPFGIPTELAS